MGRRAITNIILSIIFAITLVVVCLFRERIVTLKPLYELASLQSSESEKIINHTGYTVSYNKEWRIPNWVAYELTKDEVDGSVTRENNFQDDPSIYGEPSSSEYTHSGYDRGHMAPAGDMKWSETAMKESFYMTNICPQNHNLNGGDWKDLEEHVRFLAKKYNSVYVCCGPIVQTKHATIGYSFEPIVVPNAFFKVLLRQRDSTWTAIGFKMDNKAGHNSLATYAMSVDELEKLTEIDFFYNLPDSIEEFVEGSYVLSDWDLNAPILKTNKKQQAKPKVKQEQNHVEQSVTEQQQDEKEEILPIEAVEALPVETNSSISTSNSSSTHQSSYNGHTIYTGPRGGRYYYNSKGKKVYIKR